jgi:tRNA A-37 threonylcarbamoyl transferase component Bud32
VDRSAKLRSELARDLGGGSLDVRARDAACAELTVALAARIVAQGGRAQEFALFAGARAYVKASPLAGRARVRWAVQQRVFGRLLPRAREYENLRWLREHGFRAPEPLAAAWLTRGGCACFQLLVTRAVEGVRAGDEVLARGTGAEKRALVLGVAETAARLHALDFVHRDLHPRNVLTDGDAVWLLDCWKGGPPRPGRAAAYDLATFLVRAPEWIGAELQREFVHAYAAARAVHGVPVRALAPFCVRITRARTRLARRLAARPSEWRGLGEPVREWNVTAE